MSAPPTNESGITDEKFMENVVEARINGYYVCCIGCGTGVYDGSEIHEKGCRDVENVETMLDA